MTTFLMFGKYSREALKGISAARTKKAETVIHKHGGKLVCAYALIGCHDLVLIVELPDVKEAMRTSMELTKLTGIGFTSSPALCIAEFDELA